VNCAVCNFDQKSGPWRQANHPKANSRGRKNGKEDYHVVLISFIRDIFAVERASSPMLHVHLDVCRTVMVERQESITLRMI
jgi:hypothetical protein